MVTGVVLIGPPAVEALSINKPQESIDKVWRLVGTPVGAALFRFALAPSPNPRDLPLPLTP